MATNPGIMTDWPWKPLGNFKYAILAPWVAHSVYSFMAKGLDLTDFEMVTTLYFFVRYLHNQIWISLSRYQTARGYKRIVDRSIEFDQIDRESNWDDQIILQSLLYYGANMVVPHKLSNVPIWRSDGVILTMFLHAGPVEFLCYWLHRALHHNYLFTRYHSHHHSSIVLSLFLVLFSFLLYNSVIHPFAEIVAYFVLIFIPLVGVLFTGRTSLAAVLGYILYVDFMNNLGHCNFEIIPKCLFSMLPPLKYLMYTPSFHSLHHTQFRTNYSLFMPFYDYVYNTWDHSSDHLHHLSLQKVEDSPNVVHLSHFTTPNSIYQFRLGYSSLALRPRSSSRYLWILWPFTALFMLYIWLFGHTIMQESNYFDKVKSEIWIIPRFQFQYLLGSQKVANNINNLIEEAIIEAERAGSKVLSLGLLNQAKELNRHGEVFIKKNPKMKIRVVDGSSLAAAVVINLIPKGTTQLVFAGKLTKVAEAILTALCHSDIQKIVVLDENEYRRIKHQTQYAEKAVHTIPYGQKIWLVGDELSKNDQLKAAKGTKFIPYSQFPPKPIRKDCFYYTTPAMLAPPSLKNLDSCENWLPRRVLSAWRIAGIIHALEDWKVNECGDYVFNIQQIWKVTLRHGFRPLTIPINMY